MTNPFTDVTSATPTVWGARGKLTIPVESLNQTIGGSIYTNYLPITPTTTAKAREAINRVPDRRLASNAEAVIGSIEATLTGRHPFGLEPTAIPELQVFLPEDGSILLEWGTPSYRVGFSFERDDTESAWYLVSTRDLGQIGASGYIARADKDKLVPWLLDFVAANS
jgi:hypothetical protein